MNLQNKWFVASYSGGKDSALALHRAVQQGMVPQCLLVTYNTNLGRSWFHGIPEPLLELVSRSLNIPIRLIFTNGEDYQEQFIAALIEQKTLGAEVCIFGDIDIEDHLDWCTNICKQAGITPYFPLWQEPREHLVREFIAEGFIANITVVDTKRLSDKHLGMVLSEDTIASIASEGADVCGENGEYHSFVSDGPLFSFPIPIIKGEKLQKGQFAVLPILE